MADSMKLSCLQENLNRGLSIVGRAVSTRGSLPITGNVLMATDHGMLKLTCTNLDLTITTWIGAMIEEEGSTTLPHKLLADLVGHMPSDRVDLTMGQHDDDAEEAPANTIMRINHGRSTTRMNTADPKDFPSIPAINPDRVVDIPVETLRSGIKLTAFSAATDESRPILTGIMVDITGNKLTMASADGFRLSIFEKELTVTLDEPIKVVIPARSMQELDRIAAQQSAPVKMHIPEHRNQVMFKLDNVEMVSQLLQGQFPNTEQLIPENLETVATVDIDDLKRAVQSAGVFARDGSNIIRMEFAPNGDSEPPAELATHPGHLTVSGRSEEVGSSTDLVDIDNIVGEANRIAFNVRYLTDAINIMDKGKATIGLNSPTNPGVIQMAGNESWKHIAMPMYVQW